MKRMFGDSESGKVEFIGVVDVMSGHAVRGVAGNRNVYQRLDCSLVKDGDAIGLARKYWELGLQCLYVADLDAITGRSPQIELLKQLTQTSPHLYLDAAFNSYDTIRKFRSLMGPIQTTIVYVVGLESLETAAPLQEFANNSQERLAFSLDLKSGQPLTMLEAWKALTPLEIVEQVVRAGFDRLIVLDLASVGVSRGCPTLELCRSIRNRYPEIELITGGGVRGPAEIHQLGEVCDGILLGTLLYDCPEALGLGCN